MNYKDVCDSIFRLYEYAIATKMIHYSIDSMHGHKLADEVYEELLEFIDTLAEQYFGYFGKPSYAQLSLQSDIKADEDISRLCQNFMGIVDALHTEFSKDSHLSGIVSAIDSFKEHIATNVFLATFDKVSKIKLNKD